MATMLFTWIYPAKVLRWVDGDTVHLELDLGFRVGWKGSCRIASIDTPELPTVEGQAALETARALAPVGTVLRAWSRKLDQYGRPLVDLELSDGRDFGKEMIARGLAIPYGG